MFYLYLFIYTNIMIHPALCNDCESREFVVSGKSFWTSYVRVVITWKAKQVLLHAEHSSRKGCQNVLLKLNPFPTDAPYCRLVPGDDFQVALCNRDKLRQDPPPLDLSFWSFLTFLHYGIEDVERHLLWKFYKKIQRKSWSNVPPKLLACIGFLYKVVHKNGRLRKFNHSREI